MTEIRSGKRSRTDPRFPTNIYASGTYGALTIVIASVVGLERSAMTSFSKMPRAN